MTTSTGKAIFSFTILLGCLRKEKLQDQFQMTFSKIVRKVKSLKGIRVSDLRGKMLQKGNDESKRHPSLQIIKGKKALPSGNTHYGKYT
jgi:hypothetical protein